MHSPRSALPRPIFQALLLAGLALAPAACGGVKIALSAPPAALADLVQIRTFGSYAVGDRIFIKSTFTNTSHDPITIDRDGFRLKLLNGEVLDRSSGSTTQHKPYTIAPGASHDVFVDFHASHELGTATLVTLVVGGVSVGADLKPRVIGEFQLSQASIQQ